jgi:hypothetical protein
MMVTRENARYDYEKRNQENVLPALSQEGSEASFLSPTIVVASKKIPAEWHRLTAAVVFHRCAKLNNFYWAIWKLWLAMGLKPKTPDIVFSGS